MAMPHAYLDWNATAPLRPEAAAAMTAAFARAGNASSVHAEGRWARQTIEDARAAVAALVGAKPGEIVFTSGGTEANNLALKGAVQAAQESGARYTRLFVSAIEHDSVHAVAELLGEDMPGLKVSCIPVTRDGVLDRDALAAMLREGKGKTLISVMLANNETGAVQPVAEVAAVAADYGATVHTDAVQAPGKMPVDIAALGVHMMTLSAHKIGGPQGVGALVVRGDMAIKRQVDGGGQEAFRRAGTENVAGIAGFAAAAQVAATGHEAAPRIAALRDRIEREALARVPEARVYGAGAPRLPNTACIGVPGLSAETQVIALDLAGLAVSAGSACSSGKVRSSRVLTAMGASAEEAASAIRVSIGPATTDEDAARFVDAWETHVRRAMRAEPALRAAG